MRELGAATLSALLILIIGGGFIAESRRVDTSSSSSSSSSADDGWSHGWDDSFSSQQMWVDFAGVGYQYLPTMDEIEFVASHYSIVSLEKCFAERNFTFTEDAVDWMAKRLKEFNPNTIRVLFYHNSLQAFPTCYGGGADFLQHPDWWLENDQGKPYGSYPRYDYNFFDDGAREFLVKAATNISSHYSPSSDGKPNSKKKRLIDGIFFDSTGKTPFQDMTPARQVQLNSLRAEVVNRTRVEMKAKFYPTEGPGLSGQSKARLIANGLSFYPFDKDHGLSLLQDVDGFCFEHFLAFEMLDPTTGALVPSLFLEAMKVIHTATDANKVVLVRGWPGPVTTPITQVPSWSKAVGKPTPTTNEGLAEGLVEMLHTSWSAYLILANNWTYYSYNWWYNINNGVTPCPEGNASYPKKCMAPAEWFPQIDWKIGAPLGNFYSPSGEGMNCKGEQDPHLRGTVMGNSYVYCREFEHVLVQFNAANVSNSFVERKT